MSEVINNKYLDFGGLKKYDELIKALIASGDKELADAIAALDAKVGSLDFGDSDGKNISSAITEIYTSVEEIVAKQGELGDKDDELEGKINDIIGDLESLGEGDAVKTLVEISKNLKELNASVGKNAQDISGVDTRLTALEGAVEDLGKIEGGENLATIVTKVNTNVAEIEILKGEGDGSVKKTATDAAAAAESAAKEYADGLAANYDAAGSAASALEDAKDYVDELVIDTEGKSKFDAAGSASKALEDAQVYVDGKVDGKFDTVGSAAQALEDAIADAAGKYQEKGDYETAGSAAQALTDAKAYVDAIAHASEVKYEDGYIKLYDANGNAIGNGFDASPFVVDGMLDTVDFVEDEQGNATSILRFTFNIDTEDSENNKKTIDVDFGKYVDIYQADGTSLELTNKTFSIKEVAATKTKTVEAIPVAGGPLADLLSNAGITEIAADTSIEDVLFSLICKELWAKTLTFSEGTVASSINQPSFTLENSGKTVEVGTKCALSEITMGSATPSVSKNRTYSGFTYGYSADNDNTQDSSNTSITAGIDVDAALNEGNYTMSRDYTQFNGASDDSATANADASKVKLDGAELTVSYVGTNSVKVTVGGPTASATFSAMPVYYACSNLKKTKDAAKDSEGQYKSDAKDAQKVTSSAASNSKTLSVTGARAFWTGSVKNAMTDFTSATVRAAGESEDNHLTKSLGTNVPTTITATGGDAQVIIATQKEITEVTSKNQIGASVFGNFNHHNVSIEGANGFTAISYHVYEWSPANPFDKDDTLTITYK